MSSAEYLIAGKALLFFAIPLAIGVWEWYQLRRVTTTADTVPSEHARSQL